MSKILRMVFLCMTLLLLAAASVGAEGEHDSLERAPKVFKEAVVREYRDPGTGKLCIRTSYDRILIENHRLYEGLAAALPEVHNSYYEHYLGNLMEENKEAARECVKNFEGDVYFTAEETVQILRKDTRIVSLAGMLYTWMGGAHPNTEYYGWNFDSATGKRIYLKEVVSRPDAFIKAAVREFRKLDAEKKRFSPDSLASLETSLKKELYEEGYDRVQWTMDQSSGIRLYFNAGTFGSYAAGPVEIYLPGDKGLVKKEFVSNIR